MYRKQTARHHRMRGKLIPISGVEFVEVYSGSTSFRIKKSKFATKNENLRPVNLCTSPKQSFPITEQ